MYIIHNMYIYLYITYIYTHSSLCCAYLGAVQIKVHQKKHTHILLYPSNIPILFRSSLVHHQKKAPFLRPGAKATRTPDALC